MRNPSYKSQPVSVTILTIFILLTTACGRLELGEFAPYVQTFQEESRTRGKEVSVTNLVIQREALSPKIRAQCRSKVLAAPVIAVNGVIWDSSTEEDREALLMHELGHCILGLDHKEGELEDGSPKSLMRSVSPYGKSYKIHRDYYLDELFGA